MHWPLLTVEHDETEALAGNVKCKLGAEILGGVLRESLQHQEKRSVQEGLEQEGDGKGGPRRWKPGCQAWCRGSGSGYSACTSGCRFILQTTPGKDRKTLCNRPIMEASSIWQVLASVQKCCSDLACQLWTQINKGPKWQRLCKPPPSFPRGRFQVNRRAEKE